MSEPTKVTIKINAGEEELDIFYLLSPPSLETNIGGQRHTIKGTNLFECFATLRADYPDTRFLCKGSKVNVCPSRMSSQMSGGLLAYEVTLGKQALQSNLVNIFDYESENLTNDYQEQHQFYKSWINSLRSK